MPDKKLTDSEIVKALEIFVNSVGKGFIFANVDIKKDGINEFKHIDLSYDEIFDLINRLQDENNRAVDLIFSKNEIIENQKAEIERLKNILLCFMEALGKVRKVDDIEEISLIPIMSELNKQYRENLKAEAYKEFAERLKETMCQENELYEKCVKDMLSFDYQRGYAECNDRFVWCIDNLLKELVGEDK